MMIIFPTAPDLLRGYFKLSRKGLLGCAHQATNKHLIATNKSDEQLPRQIKQIKNVLSGEIIHEGQSGEVTIFMQPKADVQLQSKASPPKASPLTTSSQPEPAQQPTQQQQPTQKWQPTQQQPEPAQQTSHQSLWRKLARKATLAITILSLIVAGALLLPDIYYRLVPADTEPIESLEAGSPLGGSFDSLPSPSPLPVLPPKNPNLPEGGWIVIPRIGVRSELRETEDPNEALNKGVWQVPDYGDPGDQEIPMIVAAHRFGWEWWWQSDYWKYHSFYKLPELEPGDIVEIIADQRKWTYEIYAGEEGDEITDYDADLILYTCKFLNSPVRHIRYARVVDLDQVDTQTTEVMPESPDEASAKAR